MPGDRHVFDPLLAAILDQRERQGVLASAAKVVDARAVAEFRKWGPDHDSRRRRYRHDDCVVGRGEGRAARSRDERCLQWVFEPFSRRVALPK